MAIVIAATGCSYGVSFSDCELSCAGTAPCPDGFTCRDGLCRLGGATGACEAPGTVTLRQTADDKIDRNLVFACTNGDGTTAAGSWYRVFSLAEANVTATFHVTEVTLGICFAVGTPKVTAKLGTYSGTFGDTTLDLAKVAPIESADAMVPATQITELVPIPIAVDVPAGSNLVVEITVPDLSGTGQQVNIGSTDASQTHPGYLREPLCGVVQATTTTSAGHPDAAFVLTVTGMP
jgi:hypothetical protein